MATGSNSEKQPLLQNENINYGQPSAPAYNVLDEPHHAYMPTSVPPVEPNEFPPPYTSVHGTSPVVTCRVCGLTIDISGKDDQHVVQCSHCHEATPIKTAPLGKKYVRCPCNCLLICKVSSKKISCPRQNCKRIISLSPSSAASIPHSSGVCQVSCPYCQCGFAVNLIQKNRVRCIQCRKICALIPEYARKKAYILFAASLCILITLIIVIVSTASLLSETPGIYVSYFLLIFTFIALLVRGFYFFTMKAVIIETP